MPRSRAREPWALQGILAVLAPAGLVLFLHFRPELARPLVAGPVTVVWMAAALSLALAARLVPYRPGVGRLLATFGVVGNVALTLPSMRARPDLALLLLLAAGVVLVRIWPRRAVGRPSGPVGEALWASTRGACVAAIAVWAVFVPGEWGADAPSRWAAGTALVVPYVLGARWLRVAGPMHAAAWRKVLLVGLLGLLGALVSIRVPALALTWLAAGSAGALWVRRRSGEGRSEWEAVLDQPARLLVASFAGLALAGGVLLSLPAASTRPAGLPFIDALFTAVSAACVTGLVVVDTPTDLTALGQVVTLGLFQVGGLGIMTFSTAAFFFLGRRMSLRHEAAATGLLGAEHRGDVFRALRQVLGVTVTVEALGALVLTWRFAVHGDPLPVAAWRGLFTAVSAFCNAGFALQGDSLVAYQGDPVVLLVISGVIVVGGLGPAAVVALPALLRRRASVETRLVYAATVLLLSVAFSLVLAVEWSNTLAELPPRDRIANAWFHAVSLRTAGFNAIDLAAVHPATITLMVGMMFVGGSPGSTAGGVKTTTVALLVLAVVAAIRGRAEASAFGRRIPHTAVFQAAAITTVGVTLVAAALVALQITQELPFELALFEVVSALGTVGLSMGATAELDGVGKVIVMLCMFTGRVGPLTLFLVLSERREPVDVTLPVEHVAVG